MWARYQVNNDVNNDVALSDTTSQSGPVRSAGPVIGQEKCVISHSLDKRNVSQRYHYCSQEVRTFKPPISILLLCRFFSILCTNAFEIKLGAFLWCCLFFSFSQKFFLVQEEGKNRHFLLACFKKQVMYAAMERVLYKDNMDCCERRLTR